ncbi:NADPH-Fe(3+) oxidoreductase subunit alpha [invertebrate metagenome]|uniref:NADPH-Fe(3+) oxidoreductase subunit alpha n=1 Tax=invertebrate metagenome TaxID=1711999 RepID=A0A2H9T673_9ZZZZ
MKENSTLMINHQRYTFDQGDTLLDVAKKNCITIPTLCHLKDTMPTGACRLCQVEVKGSRDLMTACDTPACEGMVIETESDKVIEARKQVIGMMLASGSHDCLLCYRNGTCELQDLAVTYQVDGSEFPHMPLNTDIEDVNPLIARDFSRCVLCGRCVKACNEVQVHDNLSFSNRGELPKIHAGLGDLTLKDSDCAFCGECIQACPTGALFEKKSRFAGKPWEQKTVRTTCPYCGVGCQLDLHINKDNKIVRVTGTENAQPNKGRTCVKGRFGYDFIYSDKRLTTPLIRKDGELQPASWDKALDLVANKFKQIIHESGPDALAGVSCARSTNEDSFQMQKLFRTVFGTNNIDHCART